MIKRLKLAKILKSQFAMEFVLVFAFAFVVFLVLLSFITGNIDENRIKSKYKSLDLFAENLKQNIDLAYESGTGFSMNIILPDQIEGDDYNTIMEGGVLYVNQSRYVIYKDIPFIVNNFTTGCNTISKQSGVIRIDPCT